MLDIALVDDLKTVFTAQLLNSDEDAVGRMLNHPHSIVSLSDAGAHLTFFNDAGFGLHLLGHWSRDLGTMSLAEAVRRLTSHPASVLGLLGRGTISRGPGRRPAAVRSADRRPRAEAARPRLAGGRGATDHRCDRRRRRLGQRPPGRRRQGPVRGRAARRRTADALRGVTALANDSPLIRPCPAERVALRSWRSRGTRPAPRRRSSSAAAPRAIGAANRARRRQCRRRGSGRSSRRSGRRPWSRRRLARSASA